MDQFGRNYLQLTLEIDKHIAGYVDAYVGPPDLKEAVAATPPQAISTLQAKLAWLQANLPTGDEGRQQALSAKLRAIDCTLRMLAGEAFDYLDEVYRIYDIRPQPVPEAIFTEAHNQLDTLFEGQGSLSERMKHWFKQYELPSDQIVPLLATVRAECRRRTEPLVSLIDGENIEVTLTKDQPWGAYNWYLGNAQSHIEFNIDNPLSALRVTSTMAHEAYPGHHTECQLKDVHLYQGQGYVEYATLLLHSPAAVIAEGLATLAAEMIFPDGELAEWNASVVLPQLEMPPVTATWLRDYGKAANALRYVSGNAAYLYHTGELDEASTIDYLQTYGLRGRTRSEKSFQFISHPLFRSYVYTYTEGYDLFTQAAEGKARHDLFVHALSNPILPSALGHC